jgi:hypothetical protein
MARPTFKPTAVQRQKVAVAAGAGMAHEDIAVGLGISRNTLEKHFKVELSTAAYGRRMDVLLSLFRAAKKGSSSAAKAYLANEPRLAVPPMPAPDVTPGKPAVPEERLGKKAQAEVDARTAGAGGEWGDLLRPRGAPLQ